MKQLVFVVLILHFSLLNFAQSSWQFHQCQPITILSDPNVEESLPLLSAEKNTLFFVRTDSLSGQNIWLSRREDSLWSSPQLLPAPVNSADHDYLAGVFSDGIFKVRSFNMAGKKINRLFATRINEGLFSQPQAIQFPAVSSSGDFTGFFIPESAEKVIISMDKNGSEDLYIVLTDPTGNWLAPIALGDSINTNGFEISPFLLNDTTLFFSSNGRSDSEGADIYYANRKGDGWQQWTTPQKVKGVNSSSFDAYYYYDDEKEMAYWVSDRNGTNTDIFSGILYQDTSSNTSEGPQVVVYDRLPDFITEDNASEAGNAHIYFDLASSELQTEMKKLLQMIAYNLQNSNHAIITLKGYADDLGSYEYNLNLSAQRAKAVKKYLERLGIKPDLLEIEPMGEVTLKSSDNKMQRELNRRVDIVIN